MCAVHIRNRGHLPHWESSHGIYFVTFRLADSLPQSTIRRICDVEDAKPLEERHFSKQLEDYLDCGTGSCYLKQPEFAELVVHAFRKFDGIRYRMLAWCVMPNHVHAVFQPLKGHALAGILHTWKSFTALQINRRLGRSGALWQKEYYDHLIRDGEQLKRALRYTVENPVKAGLRDWPYVYVSAAALGGEAGKNVARSA